MIDLYDEFRAVVAALEAAGVPYAVCGERGCGRRVEQPVTVGDGGWPDLVCLA